MKIKVDKAYFNSRSEVMHDIAQCGTWPTTYVSGTTKAATPHWHEYDVHVYIMEGNTYFLDADTREKHQVSQGDKIIIPARKLHAEGDVLDRAVYIVALPNAVEPQDFLVPRSPDNL